MVQILINLIAGAIGGAATGKSSPTFDLGTVGNIISGLVGGGVLGQIATLALPSILAAAQSGNLSVGGGDLSAGRGWRWRSHTHGDHWGNQKQSNGLTLASAKATWVACSDFLAAACGSGDQGNAVMSALRCKADVKTSTLR